MVDFINDDHKEMHEVLLRSGFTFEQNAKWHPDGDRWNFVYQKCFYDASWLIFFDKSRSIVYAKIYSGQGYTCDVPYFEPLNGKTFKEVTAYFTQEKFPIKGASTGELGSKEKPTESRHIEVITPELLAANGWVKDDFCWRSPYKGMTFQFIQLDNGPYYQVTLNGDSRNTCRTSMAKAVLGFLNGYGLELLPLTYADVLKSEGFIEVDGLFCKAFIGGNINITSHALDNTLVFVLHNQSGNSLVAPKNNPAKILQAVKLLEDFAKAE